MRLLNKKYLVFSILVLVFSVAVSGGCGGGGGGHYYGNFGNSSQDVTPPVTPESQDVIPEPLPENPTSEDQNSDDNGDDYGAGKDYFAALNNTMWIITDVTVDSNRNDCKIVDNSYSHQTQTLKLETLDDEMVWYDDKDTKHPHFNDFTVRFIDSGIEYTAPLIRPMGGFKRVYSTPTDYTCKTTFGDEFEEIYFIEISSSGTPDKIRIMNTFKVASQDEGYSAAIELTRVEHSFSMLNNTNWFITTCNVFTGNNYNYPCKSVTLTSDNRKIRLETLDDEMIWWDSNRQPHFDDFTIQFYKERSAMTPENLRTAPVLRPMGGFKRSKNGTYVAQLKKEDDTIETEEIEVEKLSGDIVLELSIRNTFQIDNVSYRTYMRLVSKN